MSFSSSPFALIGAIIAAGLCLFLAFQAAALLLPFVMSSSYRWILVPLVILLMGLCGLWRARKKRNTLQPHQTRSSSENLHKNKKKRTQNVTPPAEP